MNTNKRNVYKGRENVIYFNSFTYKGRKGELKKRAIYLQTLLSIMNLDNLFSLNIGISCQKKNKHHVSKLLDGKIRNCSGFQWSVSRTALTLERPRRGGGQMDPPINFSDLKFQAIKTKPLVPVV